tara:strand:+ start:65 stop:343 length:279 start_codon:yes stop_codon:yes gene_type:complete
MKIKFSRDKRGRFLALAKKRVDKAVNAIRLIENLSVRSNYDYTDSELEQIIKELEKQVKGVKAKFRENRGVSRKERNEYLKEQLYKRLGYKI